MLPLRRFCLIFSWLALTVIGGKANQIVWGTSVSLTDVNFTSSGAPLDNSFTYALGTFGATFSPDGDNVDFWASNWKVLDTAVYNPAYDYFASETNLVDNAVFAAGEKAYIWIYNNHTISTNTEWLLVHGVDKNADPWEIPATPGTVTSFPLDFRISRVTETIFGGYNNTQGPGGFSTTPANFTLQTHTFPSLAIPEPGTTGLLAAGLAGLFRRRRRAAQPSQTGNQGHPPLSRPPSRSPRRVLHLRLVSRLAVLATAGALPAGPSRDAGHPRLLAVDPLAGNRPAVPGAPLSTRPGPAPPGAQEPGLGNVVAYHSYGLSADNRPPAAGPSGPERTRSGSFQTPVPAAPIRGEGLDFPGLIPAQGRPAEQGIFPGIAFAGTSGDLQPAGDPPGSISGFVLEDTDDDNTGDLPMTGITLTLKNAAGADVDSDVNAAGIQPTITTTAVDGGYTFTGLEPGSYRVTQTQPGGYVSVSDVDGDNLDEIGDLVLIVVDSGADTPAQNFVEELIAGIAGMVLADTDNNGTGDAGIVGVTLTLFTDPDGDGNPSDGMVYGNPETTAVDGGFSFTGLPAGGYLIVQSQPSGYLDVSDGDLTADAAGSPGDAPNNPMDSYLAVRLKAGETDTGNTFVEELPGSISGLVLTDSNNDNTGDDPVADVILTLRTGTGTHFDREPNTAGIQPYTVSTAANGSYSFTDLPPGSYQVAETQPAGYFSVSDADGGNPDLIGDLTLIQLNAGGAAANRNFIEEQSGSISGSVLADTDNDDLGDAAMANVILTLLDHAGSPVDGDPDTAGVQPVTAVTNAGGFYLIGNVRPGTYGVAETQPSGFASVSDSDGGNLNEIRPITVTAAFDSGGHFFVEEQPASISGLVLEDTNNDNTGEAPLANVVLTLKDGTGADIDSNPNTAGIQPTVTTTAADGRYSFPGLLPGFYRIVETQPAGYLSVGDTDGGNPDVIGNSFPIELAAGGSAVNKNFIEEQPGSIRGAVLADTDNNNSGDTPLANVTLTLLDGAGSAVDGDPLAPGVQPVTALTLGNGSYTFSVVPPGVYGIGETQPSGYLSVGDRDGGNPDEIRPVAVTAGAANSGNNFVEEQPGSISGSVLADSDNNGSGDTALGSVLLTLKDGAGADLDSDPNLGGVQPTVTPTASDGSYGFANLPPGPYQVWETQPSGYQSVSDADGGNPDLIGDPVPIMVSAGNATVGRNFVDKVIPPDTFSAWKTANGLTGADGEPLPDGSGLGGNPDTDIYSNLLEYAFGFPPRSGVSPRTANEVRVSAGGRIDYAVTYNNSLIDVTIGLDVAGSLGSPAAWEPAGPLASTITDNLDGTSTIVFEDLESLGAAFADGDGFVRVRVGLDINGDTDPDLFDFAPVSGWTDHNHAGRIPLVVNDQATTFSMPYLKAPLISGSATGNTATAIDLTDAAGGAGVAGSLNPAKRYFAEITGGILEGHRFEINVTASTATVAALKSVSPVNTRSLTAGALTGAPVVIRELATFDQLFPPDTFQAGTSSSDADSLLVHQGTGWKTYFLADLGPVKRWVLDGDAGLADQGLEILPPGAGLFVHRRGTSLKIARHGFVRENAFALPLPGTGCVLMGSAYPGDQSYASRGMTVAAGFQGGVDLSLSSQMLFWTGDTVTGATGYTTDFLLDGGSNPLRYWSSGDDSFLTNKNALPLFKGTGAAFVCLPSAVPGYVIPAQWYSAP